MCIKVFLKTRKYSRNLLLPIHHQTLTDWLKASLFSKNSWLDGCHSFCPSQNQYFEAFLDLTVCEISISVPIGHVAAPLSCQEQLLQHGILLPIILNQALLGLGVCATGSQIEVRSTEFWSRLFWDSPNFKYPENLSWFFVNYLFLFI